MTPTEIKVTVYKDKASALCGKELSIVYGKDTKACAEAALKECLKQVFKNA